MSTRRKLKKHSAAPLGLTTDAESIIAYLQGDLELTQLSPTKQQKMERITQAKAWMFEHKTQSKVVKMMCNHYGYSEITAYRDLRLMSQVFGPIMDMKKEFKRALADEMIRQDRELAIQRKDIKSLTSCTRNYIQLHQLDKEDPELPDLSDFEFHNIILAVLPEQVGQEPVSDEELNRRLSDWFEEHSETIDYDESETDTP